jgi:eukaryotic-like serine/threonine-protein kinase
MATDFPGVSRTLRERLERATAGRYLVTRELGRGGMAMVFEATDLPSGHPVAIKLLLPEITLLVGAERFHQEITFLRRLTHPNIVPVLESHETGPLLYYTMPRIEGETLQRLIERVGPLPLEQTLGIARDVAAALDYAHAANVLHRDIKPENILLEPNRAVVCDFGVARAIERAGGGTFSSSGILIGTPEYMSPEQARGDSVLDARCDVYGLGCVIYEMLSGEPVFSGPTAQAILARQQSAEPRSLRVVRPDLPERVEEAVLAALAKQAAERPRSGSDLVRRMGG